MDLFCRGIFYLWRFFMKFLSYSFLLIALIGASINEPLKAQEGAASTIAQTLTQAYNGLAPAAEYCADKLNPWKIIFIQYPKLAWFVGSELCSAISESAAKKEFNDRMGYACLQTVGFVALTASPWLVWKLWGKKAYNRQVEYYTYIREAIKRHYEHLTDPTYFNSNNHFLNQSRLAAYSDESEKVIKSAKLCRKTSMLYLAKDSTIVELVNNFYANRSPSDLYDCCKAIKDHCNGKIK